MKISKFFFFKDWKVKIILEMNKNQNNEALVKFSPNHFVKKWRSIESTQIGAWTSPVYSGST